MADIKCKRVCKSKHEVLQRKLEKMGGKCKMQAVLLLRIQTVSIFLYVVILHDDTYFNAQKQNFDDTEITGSQLFYRCCRARRWMTAGTCVYPCALLWGMLSGHQNGHWVFGTGKEVFTSSNMQTKCTDDNTAGRICGSCPTKLYNHSCIPYHREGWVRRTEMRCRLVRTQMHGIAFQPKWELLCLA